MVSRAAIVLLIGLVGMFYQGFLVSPPRVRLRDGRYLAYTEKGVPKDQAKHSIIIVHGFGSSKDMNFLAPQKPLDIVVLIRYLDTKKRCIMFGLNYIPNRQITSLKIYISKHMLAGVPISAPVINYRWPSFPESLIKEDYRRKLINRSMWFANYFPTFLHWWVTQKWLPSNSVIEINPTFFNKRDIDILETIPGFQLIRIRRLQRKHQQQGEQVLLDTLRSDWMVAFGNWEFDPLKLSNPFPDNRSSANIWQGYDEDKVVPSQIQRLVTQKLPWIQYHEVPDGGHLIVHYSGLCEAIHFEGTFTWRRKSFI
ncbi:hypothetical protein JHK84_027960 [Glycine max]|uniref:AB hydrolase-1 domain-containing protein n=1 Tax=Glycine max TaxID=3847 RepID=K7LIF2_SOYBN|nr:hypothetical protein JHK85_028367 [Glycine max]KAG5003706.1 hypothetical protein JHK86_027845 [Glycine max]KAG5151488.1 hypothetical protein JHK84_027960 [Glycine max]